jgi:hypothetical protein
MRSEYAVT